MYIVRILYTKSEYCSRKHLGADANPNTPKKGGCADFVYYIINPLKIYRFLEKY